MEHDHVSLWLTRAMSSVLLRFPEYCSLLCIKVEIGYKGPNEFGETSSFRRRLDCRFVVSPPINSNQLPSLPLAMADPHAVGDTKTYLQHPMSISPSDPSLCKTAAGLIRGSVGARHLCWFNVPYAAPPVGELRWKPPKTPHSSWDDVRNGQKQG